MDSELHRTDVSAGPLARARDTPGVPPRNAHPAVRTHRADTMFMHSARLAAMERHLRGPDADLGTLRSAQVAFCFNAPAEFLSTDIRLQPSLEPAGAIGDLGHYCIRFALFAFGWDRPPAAVSATLHATAGGGTPSAATATLVWAPIDGDGGVPPVCVRVVWAEFNGAAGC